MSHVLANSLLWPAEKMINLLMQRDSHVEKKLAHFSGKSIEIESSSPHLQLTIKFYDNRVRLIGFNSELTDSSTDLKISGDCEQLLQLLLNKEVANFTDPNISVLGDAGLAQELYKTVLLLDVDWPSLLTPLIGHVVTNELHKNGENVIAWATQIKDTSHINFQDYVKEELKIFPHPEDLESFRDDIDLLRLRIDRVMARTDLLAEYINEENSQ
tara:strand:- start:1344 stop:1985 length:642 start_codon:yes stop_codon:yes gene_type:complete